MLKKFCLFLLWLAIGFAAIFTLLLNLQMRRYRSFYGKEWFPD